MSPSSEVRSASRTIPSIVQRKTSWRARAFRRRSRTAWEPAEAFKGRRILSVEQAGFYPRGRSLSPRLRYAATIRRWISDGPSTIWNTFASRIHFSTGWSRMIPAPPSTCTASVVMRIAASAANAFAKEPSRPASTPASTAAAARQTSRRAASTSMAMSASLKPTPWRSRIGRPNASRSRAYQVAYSKAARATPIAPAATCGRDARIVALDQERRDLPVELREGDRDVGDAAVRDVDLLAAQQIVVSVPPRLRTHRGYVGARVRLGERDRRERPLLACEQRQVAGPLRVGPEPQQRPDREHRRLDRRGEPGAAPRQLLGDQRARHRAGTATAVLGGNGVGRQPRARGLLEQAGRVLLALVPLRRDRPQLALRELVGEPLQLALLGRRLERDQKVKSSMPPLTFSATPVMYDARSEQRKAIAFATSCGSPARRIAVRLTIRSFMSGLPKLNASVPMIPGTIALQVMPWRAPSS